MITKEIFMAAIAMRLVDRRFLHDRSRYSPKFAAYIGDERVPPEMIAEVHKLIPLIWANEKLLRRDDWMLNDH